MEFTVNLTTADMARATDYCGVRSGRDHDKWKECDLTPEPGQAVRCPSIKESPLCIECRVKQIVHLGSHDMFIAEVANVLADEQYIDPATGAFDLAKANLLSYSHGKYFDTGKYLGHFGFSVKKKNNLASKVLKNTIQWKKIRKFSISSSWNTSARKKVLNLSHQKTSSATM